MDQATSRRMLISLPFPKKHSCRYFFQTVKEESVLESINFYEFIVTYLIEIELDLYSFGALFASLIMRLISLM